MLFVVILNYQSWDTAISSLGKEDKAEGLSFRSFLA